MQSDKELETLQLSLDEIRKFKGLENLTDEDAENIASSLREFSLITYRVYEYEVDQLKST